MQHAACQLPTALVLTFTIETLLRVCPTSHRIYSFFRAAAQQAYNIVEGMDDHDFFLAEAAEEKIGKEHVIVFWKVFMVPLCVNLDRLRCTTEMRTERI